MDPFWKATIRRQFGAAIDALEHAIRACPDEVWTDASAKPAWRPNGVAGFWYVAFHALFFLDFYMSDSPREFVPPPPFGLSELDPAGMLPDRAYTKDELLKYLEYSRSKARAAIENLTEDKARGHCGFPGRELSRVELLLYTMRHVQHHAGQLNLLLRQQTGSAPRWVSASTL